MSTGLKLIKYTSNCGIFEINFYVNINIERGDEIYRKITSLFLS